MEISDRMFSVMEKKQLKMAALAKMLGISKSVVSTWKSRSTNPPLEYTVRICDFLGVSYAYFLTGIDDCLSQNDTILNGEAQELIANYNRLDNRGKHKLHTVIYDELDRMQHTETLPPIPFAASGWADMPPEAENIVQQHLQQFEQKNMELHQINAAKDAAVLGLLKKGLSTKEP